jgi:hypothetical protein
VVFCSGKIYYDLLAAREERKADHVALVRVEQLYPFAADQARDLLARYRPSAEVVWAQEEPRNMGPWRFMRECMQPLLDETRREVRYVGRAESASPATGSGKRHQQEQAEIVNDALTTITPPIAYPLPAVTCKILDSDRRCPFRIQTDRGWMTRSALEEVRTVPIGSCMALARQNESTSRSRAPKSSMRMHFQPSSFWIARNAASR